MIRSNSRRSLAEPDSNPAATGLPRLSAARKLPQDTEAGCRASAAADLDRSAALPAGLSRLRLEHSAAGWSARADLLRSVGSVWQAEAA